MGQRGFVGAIRRPNYACNTRNLEASLCKPSRQRFGDAEGARARLRKNDEARMSNDEGSQNDGMRKRTAEDFRFFSGLSFVINSAFDIRASSLFHSSFYCRM